MFLQVPDLLNAEELTTIDAAIASAAFADGKTSANEPTKPVKNNLQMAKGADSDTLTQIVVQALTRNQAVQRSCMPSRVVRPLFSRYEVGMQYGWHTDNPLMAEGRPLRTDIAATIFLSDLESYEGGDLIVNTAGGQASFRLPRGHAVFYPATSIHSVTEVTKGVRNVAVTWLQSVVASAEKRELLLELDTAARIVREKAPGSEEARLLMKTHGNLMRMWCEI